MQLRNQDVAGQPHMRAALPSGPAGSGELTVRGPDAAGVIHVHGSGLWTSVQTERHFRELRTVVDQCRARGQDIRALVDLREVPVNGGEILDQIKAGTQNVYRPDDRIAIIVRSSLVKMQMRRVVETGNLQFFLSAEAATTWLNAYA